MDPISLGVQAAGMAIGLGLQIFGGAKQAQIASQEAGVKQQIAGYEIQADQQRRRQMELDAQRKQMEVLRNAQRARALGLQAATSQGASLGSGLQGGYGQISGAANTNLLGIGQNLQIGENLFDINANVDQSKIQLAGLESQAAKYG